MFSRLVTQEIIRCWCKGISAEETVNYLKDKYNLKIASSTVYKKRNSLEGKEIMDEVMQHQMRDIQKANNQALRAFTDGDVDAALRSSELVLKYRNELLKMMWPYRVKIDSRHTSEHIETRRVMHLHMWRPNDAPAKNQDEVEDVRVTEGNPE